jgi:hypothetical protein
MPLLARVLHGIAPHPRLNQKTMLLFALYPGALYCLSGYAESLYLPLLLGFFVLLQRGRWLSAAGIAAAAVFVRTPALLLVATLAVVIVADAMTVGSARVALRRAARRAGTALPVASLGLLATMLVLYVQIGEPLAFLHAYSAWDSSLVQDWRHFTFENVAEALTIHAQHLAIPIAVAFFVLGPLAVIVQRRDLPPALLAFAACAFLLFLSQNTMACPFQNHLRWLALVFPFHYALVLCCARLPWGNALYWCGVAACLPTYAYFVSRFVRGLWVS